MPQASEAGTAKGQIKTVDEYIDAFPQEVQRVLQTVRQAIREVAPDAQEKLSYKIPAFFLNGPLIYFSAWKKHIALYPTSDEMAASIDGLAAYRSGKGTLQFPLDQPMPLPLIRKIVEFRVEENQKR
jgi:uncharacterized protein YdhG (YjbR/CyaY superfamily)